VDSHKDTLTCAAVDAASGRLLATTCVPADVQGCRELVEWAMGLDAERVWAVEDCRHLTGALERTLLAAGERAHRVAPKLMAGARSGARTTGKTDPIDAQACATALLRYPDLPPVARDEIAHGVRLLSAHREDLVQERTRMQSRVRWLLHDLGIESSIAPRTLDRKQMLDKVSRQLRRRDRADMRVRISLEIVRDVRAATRRINELERELDTLTKQIAPSLREIEGCGALTAAKIIARTEGVAFASDDKLAMLCGTAPLDASSGRQQRHRLNRRGDRQLNAAMHRIAVTQIRIHDPARTYIANATERGKTKTEALRMLKRKITRRVHRALVQDMNTNQAIGLT
jgi:transposase